MPTASVNFLILFIISIPIIIKSSDIFTEGASKLAKMLGVSDFVIGITVVALGTSLPELFVSVSAARKGFATMALGNIIGSNVANILWVLGFAAIIRPISIAPERIFIQIFFMLSLSILLIIFKRSGYMIDRREGTVFLAIYVIFVLLSIALGNVEKGIKVG